jgi:hypothetical protein
MTEDQIKAAQTLLRDVEHARYSKKEWDGIQVDGLLAMMGIHAKPETRELAQGMRHLWQTGRSWRDANGRLPPNRSIRVVWMAGSGC